MTDREPDDLFDALRERLADYGQEPPAPLWAAIRAQLPPPVASPRLRPRRRWLPALLSLLVLVGTASALWWHAGRPAPSTVNTSVPMTHKSAQSHAAGLTGSQQAAGIANSSAPDELLRPRHVPKDAAAPATRPEAMASGAGYGGSAIPRAAAGVPGASAAWTKRTTGRPGDVAAMARADTRHRRPAAAHEPEIVGSTASTRPRSNTSAVLSAMAATGQSGASAGKATPSKTELGLAGNNLMAKRVLGISARADNVSGKPLSGAAAAARDAGTAPLDWRTVPLSTAAFEGPPASMSGRDTVLLASQFAVRRWTLEVAAGPALTYRHLGARPDSMDSNVAATRYLGLDSHADQLARTERGSTGFAAQVLVRRTLNGRWSLGAGLGYQEYAMTVTQQLPVSIISQPGPATTPGTVRSAPATETHRETYRFATLPVRVGYALGQPTQRFRYGLLLGLDAAVYLGRERPGADNLAYTAAQRPSPYRPLSLSLNAGLDLRYRVASRVELLTQPTATYFLTSLARPSSGLLPRHLLGTGVLVGAAISLH